MVNRTPKEGVVITAYVVTCYVDRASYFPPMCVVRARTSILRAICLEGTKILSRGQLAVTRESEQSYA